MQRSRIILALTLLNFALLAVVIWQAHWLRVQRRALVQLAPTSYESAGTDASGSSSSLNQAASSPADGESQRIAAGISSARSQATNWPKFNWRVVESEDYQTYVQNLRNIGCPEQTIRDIVTADVQQAFAARRSEAAAARYAGFQFNRFDDESDADFARRRHEVDAAMNETLRQLLGSGQSPPSSAAAWKAAVLEQQVGFLPPEKQRPALEIFSRLGDVDIPLPRGISGKRLTSTQAGELRSRVEVFEQRRTELMGVLTPAEYEQLDMIVSWTGSNLRQAMARFEPSEEEFTAIFREWRAHDLKIAGLWAIGDPDPGNNHVFASIKNLLGPERYQLYRETWWK